jgi:hypothetical protein
MMDWAGGEPGYYVQDYEPWFFPPGSEDHGRALRSYAAWPDLVRLTKTEWTRNTVQREAGVDCTVVGPSVEVDLFRPRRQRSGPWPERPLRIAAMIRPDSPRRQRPNNEVPLWRAAPAGRVSLWARRDPGFRALPHDFCATPAATRPNRQPAQ